MISRSRLLAILCATACIAGAGAATSASAATPAWSPIAVSGPTNLPPLQSETQRLAVDAEGGTFTLTFNSQTTTAIPYNAEAATLEASLNALSSIGPGGSVAVAGGPGGPKSEDPYFLTFGGSLANTNVAQITANGASLTGSGHTATVLTRVPGGPGTGEIAIYPQNVGGFSTSGTITVTATLPAGVTTTATPKGSNTPDPWTCSPGPSTFTCTSTATVGPGEPAVDIKAKVAVGAAASGTEIAHFTVSGGGAPTAASYDMPLTISSADAKPGTQAFTAGAYDSNGNVDTRAGGHPYAGTTAIFANTIRTPFGNIVPAGEYKDIKVDLPPGFLGNPVAVPQCPESETECSLSAVVGIARPVYQIFGEEGTPAPIYNVQAPYGYPSKFFFKVGSLVPINAVGSLRSDGDYGLTVSSLNTPQIANVFGSFFTFWGAPSDFSHDGQRCSGIHQQGCGPGASTNTAFLTSPTNCAEEATTSPVTLLNLTTWQFPAEEFHSSVPISPVTECDKLKFEADFKFEPSDTKSDSPASFRTELTVPSEGLTEPSKLSTPEIKTAVVKLPKGVVLNASGADGLGACTEAQIGLKNEIDSTTGLPIPLAMPNPIRFDKEPNTCPDSSKIGSGELTTALLADPLHGALYLAAQGKGNPFGSLFAIYLVIEDPRHGIFIKLPGEVEPDSKTGQMTVSFDNLPQLPFTTLKLDLKGGNRSALASPSTCGNFVTTAINTPWSAPESGPPTESSNGFEINQGPNGAPCAKTLQERPFDLGWQAGSQSGQAGAKAPFTFQITRPDGSQEIESLQLGTPQGLAASLKGVPYCTAAQIASIEQRTGKEEQASSACPAASQVGTAVTGSGSGPSPFYTSGKLYLAGPYKGAPISVLAVTPAVAGPFDLGNVVVRSAVFIDRATAQVTAKTDPIPQILKGVVLRIRDVRIFLDRKDWTLNPTSCEPMSVNLTAHGNSGAVANKTTRFQVGGCDKLAFKPKLTGKVSGGTKRNDHPSFTAEVTYPEGPGYANIKDVQVSLPHSEFLDQSHINTVCTRAQAQAHECPAGSIYGEAEATTPLLDGVLKGPVFLKSSVHKLPDLAIALKGPDSQPIEVEFAGRIDSVHGQIRDTIEGLPDVPVSKFVLRMKGGKKGLLVNSRDLCNGKQPRMTVNMTAQNNSRHDTRPVLGNDCGKGKRHKRSHRHRTGSPRVTSAWRGLVF